MAYPYPETCSPTQMTQNPIKKKTQTTTTPTLNTELKDKSQKETKSGSMNWDSTNSYNSKRCPATPKTSSGTSEMPKINTSSITETPKFMSRKD